MNKEPLPEKIRVSSGSAVVLGLLRGKLDAEPTTAYLLTFRAGKCLANCSFCPQARTSKGRADRLSRVTWPPFPIHQVLQGIALAAESRLIERVCIQTLNDPEVFNKILELTKTIHSRANVPISISCQPFDPDMIHRLAAAGVDRITIPLDAATQELFDRVKGQRVGGPYVWAQQRETLLQAVQIMGRGHVGTHLIAGLGESEQDLLRIVQWCIDNSIYPGLFAFTPIKGTALENYPPPPLRSYRRLQLARHLITTGTTRYDKMAFDDEGGILDFGVSEKTLTQTIRSGRPFETSGCPGCNRPYYNETPGGPLYNYPRKPLPHEIARIERQVGLSCIERLGAPQYQEENRTYGDHGCGDKDIHHISGSA